MASGGNHHDQSALSRRPSRSAAMTTFSMEVFDNEVVPSSLQYSIAPILRVAAEIQNERPRVAYLCTSPFIVCSFLWSSSPWLLWGCLHSYIFWNFLLSRMILCSTQMVFRGWSACYFAISVRMKIIHERRNVHRYLFAPHSEILSIAMVLWCQYGIYTTIKEQKLWTRPCF